MRSAKQPQNCIADKDYATNEIICHAILSKKFLLDAGGTNWAKSCPYCLDPNSGNVHQKEDQGGREIGGYHVSAEGIGSNPTGVRLQNRMN